MKIQTLIYWTLAFATTLSFQGIAKIEGDENDAIIRYCREEGDTDEEGLAEIENIAEMLKSDHCRAYSLEARHAKLGGLGTEIISKALVGQKTVSTLELKGNGIELRGASAIAFLLSNVSKVNELNLSRNKIGADEYKVGIRAIAKALETNSKLVVLDLCENSLGDEGAMMIAKALRTNKTLETLRLGKNEITDAGAEAIAEALAINNTLKTLFLDENEISDVGAKKIALAIEKNGARTLNRITLRHNKIETIGINAFKDSLLRQGVEILNASFQFFYLDVQGNPAHSHQFDHYVDGLNRRGRDATFKDKAAKRHALAYLSTARSKKVHAPQEVVKKIASFAYGDGLSQPEKKSPFARKDAN